MSSQFTVKLKRKGTSVNGAPTLMWLCTTPARELTSNVGSIIWGDGKDSAESIKDLTEYDEVCSMDSEIDSFSAIRWHVLDKETMSDILSWYRARVDLYKADMKDTEDYIKECRENALAAKSTEVAQMFLDKVSALKEDIVDIQDSINEYQDLLDKFIFVKNIVDDSDNADWELVYYVD